MTKVSEKTMAVSAIMPNEPLGIVGMKLVPVDAVLPILPAALLDLFSEY
jgi:hypothetical protein